MVADDTVFGWETTLGFDAGDGDVLDTITEALVFEEDVGIEVLEGNAELYGGMEM